MNLLFFLPISLIVFLHSSPSSAFSPSRHHPTKTLNNKLSNMNMKLGYRKPSTDLYSTTLNDIVKTSSSSGSRLLGRLLFLPLALPAFLRSQQQTTVVFAAIGGLTSLFSCIAFGKLLLALKKKTNFASAILSTPPRDAFADKVVLITGASSGIGRAIALHLSSKYDNVKLILASRRQDALEDVATECIKLGASDAQVLSIDLADHISIPSKVKAALAMYQGRIDILINNGGVSTRAMARKASFDVDSFVTDVDYLSCVALTKALLPSWEKKQSSIDAKTTPPMIINTNSISGKFGCPVRTSYTGAKHAVMGWFDSFRIEQIIAGHPIDVLQVVLGPTRTNIARNSVTVSKDTSFKGSDSNTDDGLEVDFVAEKVMTAAFAREKEIWLANKKELLLLYLNQYAPELCYRYMLKLAKQYAVED